MAESLLPPETEAPPQETPPTPAPKTETPPASFDLSKIADEKGNFKSDVNWGEVLKPLGLEDQAASISKYKTLPDLLKGHGHLSKMLGKNPTAVPTDFSDEAAVEKFRKALGVPEDPTGYGVKPPEQLPEGVQWDEGELSKYLDVLHKGNATPELVQQLVQLKVESEAERYRQATIEAEREAEAHTQLESTKLKEEFGATLPATLDRARRAAIAVGLDPASNLFSTAENVKAFAKMADYIGEDQLPNTARDAHVAAYEEANRIMTDPTHPDYSRFHAGEDSVVSRVMQALKRAS